MSASWLRACALVVIGFSGSTAWAVEKPHTAIVVGGGLAGLTAAYELQSKGWQVTLLEARANIGGRSGLAASEWIGDAKVQPTLNHYLQAFQLTTQPAPDYVRLPGYLVDGEYFSAADLALKQPATSDGLKRYQQALADLANSVDNPENPAANATLFALDQTSVSSWLDKLQLPVTARQLVNQQIRTRYDEPSRLSLLFLVQQSRVYRNISDSDLRASRLPGGSVVLAQAFLKQLKVIKTQSMVSAIAQDKEGVTVKVGAVGYQADYAVLAVPLRALAQIQLTPALDAQRQAAIRSINYGWHDQLLLKFKTPVWDSKSRMTGEIFSNAGLGMLWIEPALKGGANLIVNLSGDNARVMQAFGDKQMVDQVLIRFNTFYPQARGAFTGYEIRRYSTDPGTGGSYLAYGPGQMTKFWRVWERPVQRLAFAGEHTDLLYPGTLEGALRTGQRAAGQVIDLAAGKSFEPVKAVPVAAAAAGVAGAVVKKPEGNFFSRIFGGASTPAPQPAEPAPVPVSAPAATAPVPSPVPVPAPAPVVAPVPAPVPAKAPAHPASVKKPPAKPAPVKAAPVKKPVEKKAPEKKPPVKPPVNKKVEPAA
jgi:monoamine oxidase